ncbi:MAG: hypothetical protein H8D63_00910 [Parcubacteria group bacterium]|nr:hypothetical protein [Parcubacteria group bacterium]
MKMRKILLLLAITIPFFLTGCINDEKNPVGPILTPEPTLEEKYGEEVIAMFEVQTAIPEWEEHLKYITRALKVREEITVASISHETLTSSYSVVGYEELDGWSEYIFKMLRTAEHNKNGRFSLTKARENLHKIYIAPNDKYAALKYTLIDRCLVAIYTGAWPGDFIPAIKGRLMFLPDETREFINSQKR